MSIQAVLLVIVISVVVGLGYQWLGRARETYEWAIAMVGALYGALVGSALSSSTLLPALLGALACGALMLFGFRQFDSRRRGMQSATLLPEERVSRQVRLAYSPVLLRDATIYRMMRQFGVDVTIGSVEITAGHGWVDLDVSGAPAATDASLELARRSGAEVTLPSEREWTAAAA